MTSPGAVPAVADKTWRELLSLAREDSEARLLERLTELWRQRLDCEAAAVYVRRDGHFRLEAASRTGPRSFPDRLDGPSVQGVGPELMELPGGLLAWYGPSEASSHATEEPLTLALAAALRSADLRRKLKAESFEVKYRGVELEALYDVGLAIASTLDMDALSEEILLRAVSLLDARRGALYMREPDTRGGERFRLHRTFGGEALNSFVPESDQHGRRRLRVPDDLLPGADHLLALPIEIHGDPRGALAVGDKESRTGVGPFTEQDRRTLSLFANQAAIALENARLHRQELEKQRLEREMELAAEIQAEILPKGNPEIPGYELLGWSRPARQVGGDYYDLQRLDRGALRLTVGDVTGKGIPAALLVSTLHSSLRLLLDARALEPGLLAKLNHHIHESSAANKFITLLTAEVDPETHRLRWVNAGHNPGLLVRAGGGVEELSPCGLPLGMMAGVEYRTQELQLEPGDLVCLYSDGITEAAGPEGEEFGQGRLEELLARHRDTGLEEVRDAVEEAVAELVQGAPQADDETLVLVRRRG